MSFCSEAFSVIMFSAINYSRNRFEKYRKGFLFTSCFWQQWDLGDGCLGDQVLSLQTFYGFGNCLNKKLEGKYFFHLHTVLFFSLRGGLANVSYFLSHSICMVVLTQSELVAVGNSQSLTRILFNWSFTSTPSKEVAAIFKTLKSFKWYLSIFLIMFMC